MGRLEGKTRDGGGRGGGAGGRNTAAGSVDVKCVGMERKGSSSVFFSTEVAVKTGMTYE